MASKTSVRMPDCLWGSLEFPKEWAGLFDTAEMRRLRGVQMSIPSRLLRTASSCASRFEHSVGVAHLATLVTQNPDFADLGLNLFCAALLHDAYTPPFSHATDPLLERVLHVNHEAQALAMAHNGEFSVCARRLGADLAVIVDLLEGWWFRSSPDLDNCHNTLCYGVSMGLCQPSYDPRNIARGYCLADGVVCLQPSARAAVEGWAECRQTVYGWIYSHAHQAPYFMLRRAMDIAEKTAGLPERFFMFTDDEAYQFLHGYGPAVAQLLSLAERAEYYPCWQSLNVTASLARHIDPLALADDIAEQFSLPPESVCAGFNKTRRQKQIQIPFADDLHFSFQPRNGEPVTWTLLVYGMPDAAVSPAEVGQFVERYVNQALFCAKVPA